MLKNPPANAGDTGSLPESGRSPQTAEQPSPFTTNAEPTGHSCGACALEAVLHDESSPHSPQLEKSPPSDTDPVQPKQINKSSF